MRLVSDLIRPLASYALCAVAKTVVVFCTTSATTALLWWEQGRLNVWKYKVFTVHNQNSHDSVKQYENIKSFLTRSTESLIVDSLCKQLSFCAQTDKHKSMTATCARETTVVYDSGQHPWKPFKWFIYKLAMLMCYHLPQSPEGTQF